MGLEDYGGMPGLVGPNAMGPDAVLPPGQLPGGAMMTPQQRQLLALMLMQQSRGGAQTAGKVAIPQGIGGALNGAMGAYGMMSLMGK